ncbi:MAG: DJ-1/PfpI family protein [Bacteroidota bacterium]
MNRILLHTIAYVLLISCTKKQEVSGVRSDNVIIEPLRPQKELNAAFLIVDGVYNSELMAPYDIFQHTIYHVEKGINVFTVAPKDTIITSFEGIRILPDYHFLSESLPDIDILVVPSAEHSMDSDLNNAELINFVKSVGKKAMYTISLCDGAFVLAEAGLVNGKISTTFPSDVPKYKKMFPELEIIEDVSFVHDQNLLTSAGGAKSYDVALYLCEVLYGKEKTIGIGKGLVIDWDLKNYKYKISTN